MKYIYIYIYYIYTIYETYNSLCPVVWMFHGQKRNACTNRFHKRALRLIYRDFDSSFEELLRRDSSTTLHQRNLQKRMTEIFKVKTGIAPDLRKGVFNMLIYLTI